LLIDAEGMVVHATPGSGRPRELLPIVSRVGVNLAEAAVGTNAPAVVLKTGQACTVTGAEHFFDSVQRLHCAAAPVRDAQGAVAGVLDLTVEARPFGFDASALVAVVASAIENQLLQHGAEDQLVLQFQVSHGLLGSPLQALVGVASSGRLAWANSTARQLLGVAALHGDEQLAVEALFGQRLSALLALAGHDAARTCRLPNGLTVWLQALGPGRGRSHTVLGRALALTEQTPIAVATVSDAHQADTVGPCVATTACTEPPGTESVVIASDVEPPATTGEADAPAADAGMRIAADTAAATVTAVAAAAAATLGEHQRDLIDRVLAECEGNISRAARRLGVSRGLLYRRRRDVEACSAQFGGQVEPGGSD
jgi:transcriptional regulator of acetoin/glycerol metabolism